MDPPSRNPDIEVDAEIVSQTGSLGTFPTRTWLPFHVWERHFVEVLSWDIRHKDLLGQHVIVRAPLASPGRPGGAAIIARGVRVDNVRISFSGSPPRPTVALGGEAEQLIVAKRKRVADKSADGSTSLIFRLTDNSLLRPFEQRSCFPDGRVTVEKEDGITVATTGAEDLVFHRQYYYGDNADGSMTIYRRLICSTIAPVAAVDVDWVLRTLLPRVHRVVLLASFAARERTDIRGWEAESPEWRVEVHLGGDSDQPTQPESRSVDWLIAPGHFVQFLQQTTTVLEQMPSGQREMIESAMRRTVPTVGTSMEHRYLSLFAVLESIVARHRAASGFKTNIGGKAWSKLLQALRQTVDDNAELFRSENHRKLLEKVLPRIQQVPASDAFQLFVKAHQVDLRGVWPAYGKANGSSLADIRNRLAHGESAQDWYPEVVASALQNLQVISERSILAVLGWPSSQSHPSGSALSEVDWLSSQDLDGFQRLLRRRGGD